MALEEHAKGYFNFPSFADYFPEDDDTDKPDLVSENMIEILCSKMRCKFFRKDSKFGFRILRCDDGVIPVKIKCNISFPNSRDALFEVTFLPRWCYSLWSNDGKLLDRGMISNCGTWGWNDCKIPISALRQAAAQTDGVLKLEVQITASRSSSTAMAGHESCLRGNVPEILTGLVGSPSVRLLGPDEQCIELPQALLFAHSSVLRAHLESPMEEGRSRSISFPDLKGQALQDFSTCLCTGGLPSAIVTDWERLIDLLVIADRFCVCALVDACIALLSIAISVKTVAPLMKAADEVGCPKLLRCLLYFCLASSDRMNVVIESDEYARFSADLLRNMVAHQEVMQSARFPEYPHSFQYADLDQEFNETTDWSTLSSTKLRRACFERDMPATGTRTELVKRLSTYSLDAKSERESKRQRCK